VDATIERVLRKALHVFYGKNFLFVELM